MTVCRTIPEGIKYFAETTPEKTCLIDGVTGETVSYADFWSNILRFAAFMKSQSLQAGDRVLFSTRQSLSHLTAFYGVQVAGGVAVPLERGLPEAKMLEFTDFFDAKFLVAADRLNAACRVVLYDEYKNAPPADFPLETDDGKLAVIICTTGTTGKNKGVMSSYRCRFSGADNVRHTYEITPKDTALVPQVLSHSGGLRRVEAMLVSGAAAIIMGSAMFFGNIFDAVKKHNATILQFVPAQVAQILQFAEKMLVEIRPQLRIVSVGSAVIPDAHKERLRELLPGVRLFDDFGSTEAPGSAYFEWSAYPPKPGCVGLESLHSKLVFLDDAGNVISDSSRENPGLIATEGAALMSGYWKEPELSAETLRDGRFISADLGYRGEDGLVYVLGRKDDMIICGANKISPHEIEDAASSIVGLKECAVLARPDPILGNIPVLFVAADEGAELAPLDIYLYLSERLEKFKVPEVRNIIIIANMPRSAGTGKILRRELANLL